LFGFVDTSNYEIYSLSLHDALPISAEGKNVRYPAAAAGAACGESVLRVFAGAAPHLVGRVFFSVDLHLAGHGLANVDVQAVRQTNQVDQHVGDLVGDRLTSFPGWG